MSNRFDRGRGVAYGWVRMTVAMVVAMIWPGALAAQTINPNVLEFLPPSNHSDVSRYDLAFYPVDGSSAYLTVNIGKPALQADGMIRIDITKVVSAWPAPNVVSSARVFSVLSTAAQPSTYSNSFVYQCSFTLSASSQSFAAAGGTGSVSVATPSTCGWQASSPVNWIIVNSGATGAGNGSVAYSVGPNTATTSRTASLTIGGLTYTVTQAAAAQPCTVTLSASSQSFAAAGGTGSVSVTAPGGCSWQASSPVGWIAVNAGASGTGSGTVAYSVAPNTATTSRTASLTIGGLTYAVTQAPGAADAPKTSNVAPTVSITRPSPGGVINGRQVKIDASASDADGTITSVVFLVNNAPVGTATKAPYSIQWEPPAKGSYTFTAQATDNAGLSATSAPVTATVR